MKIENLNGFEINWSKDNARARMGTLVARFDDETYTDRIDLCDASQRQSICQRLIDRFPVLAKERSKLESALEQLTTESTPRDPDPTCDSEVNLDDLVRPERFVCGSVSGITIPTLHRGPDGVSGRWQVYCQLENGKRTVVPLTANVAPILSPSVIVQPIPDQPDPSVVRRFNRWSQRGRDRWLSGESALPLPELIERLSTQLGRFLYLEGSSRNTTLNMLTFWILMTYIVPLFSSVPYLFVNGVLGSGKSRVLEILELLCFRPIKSSQTSAPALFRELHQFGGTALLDEAEHLGKKNDPNAGDLTTILLAGYRRGSTVQRAESVGRKFETRSFDVFGPKALACINALPAALISRCLVIQMRRTTFAEGKQIDHLNPHSKIWQELRDHLHEFSMNFPLFWNEYAQSSIEFGELHGRTLEIWSPILQIAATVDGHYKSNYLSTFLNHARESEHSKAEDLFPEEDLQLLRTLRRMNARCPTAKEILEELQRSVLEMFRHWSPAQVANRLRQYGIPKAKKSGSRREYRVPGNCLLDLEKRYNVDLDVIE